MKDSRGVPKYLLGILSRGCVLDVTGSVGYPFVSQCMGLVCYTDPFKFRWSRGYIHNESYHHQIVVVCLMLYNHMLSVAYIFRQSWVLILLLVCSLIMRANNRVHYGPMVVFVCLHIASPHYHHNPVTRISRYWSCKILGRYILSSMSKCE